MASEATKRYSESAAGDVVQDYTCANATGIEKGTLLKLTTPRTAAASDGNFDIIAGIAAREKIANDGRTQISVHKRGFFDMTFSGACGVGQAVVSACASGANVVRRALTGASGAMIIGYAEEDVAAEGIGLVRLNL